MRHVSTAYVEQHPYLQVQKLRNEYRDRKPGVENFLNLTDQYRSTLEEWRDQPSFAGGQNAILTPQVIHNAASLCAMGKMAQDEGFQIDPTNKETDRWIEKRFGLKSRMSEGFQLLAENPDSEVQKISKTERWRICGIDPIVVEALEYSPIAESLRPLMPLLFDNINRDGGKQYFYRKAAGWHEAMRDVHKPITTKYLDTLNGICSSEKFQVLEGFMENDYGMIYGKDLTQDGFREFEEFNSYLKNNDSDDGRFFRFDKSGLGCEGGIVKVKRNRCDPSVMKKIFDGILTEYYRPYSPEHRKFEVAQDIVRLHRYADANLTTAALALNRMRRADGEPLVIYKDPNVIVGHSAYEIAHPHPDMLLDLNSLSAAKEDHDSSWHRESWLQSSGEPSNIHPHHNVEASSVPPSSTEIPAAQPLLFEPALGEVTSQLSDLTIGDYSGQAGTMHASEFSEYTEHWGEVSQQPYWVRGSDNNILWNRSADNDVQGGNMVGTSGVEVTYHQENLCYSSDFGHTAEIQEGSQEHANLPHFEKKQSSRSEIGSKAHPSKRKPRGREGR